MSRAMYYCNAATGTSLVFFFFIYIHKKNRFSTEYTAFIVPLK